MDRPDPIPENRKDEEDDDIVNEDDDGEQDERDIEDDEEEYEEEDEEVIPEPRQSYRSKMATLSKRMQDGAVPLRVHDVIFRGNSRTKESLLEEMTAPLKDASTMEELLEATKLVSFRLKELEVFDSIKVTLDSGPLELPGTANVIVEVVETKSPLTGEMGVYTKGEARASTVEGSLKYKNIFGYGDLWDGSVAYNCDHMGELSAGVYLPRLRGFRTPVTARAFLLSQDWLKFSSFKERSMGLSIGLYSSRHHDVSYTLAWRTLTDPPQTASRPVRRQLGHGLLSSLKYTFKLDRRNSALRPTRGYAFVSSSQISGLLPDTRAMRFLRQEFDLRYALPLGFCNSALNFGIAAGVLFPWGPGCSNMLSPLPERFFLGGNLSPVCTVGGPATLWGFRTRGLGPTEPRRLIETAPSESLEPERDYLGGDVAVTAFADLSFDLPSNWLRAKGIHGHVFACAGNADKLSENAYRNFSLQKFRETVRSSVGVGIVIPTILFRMELNYCHLLKKQEHDRGKSGFRVCFSTPSS